MMKKALVLLFLVVLSGCSPAATPAKPQEMVDITIPVGYIPNVQFAPLYVAMEKGWFKEAGFNVTLDYSFETDAVALVGADKLQFAVVSGEQVLLARAQGLPVVYTFAWYQQYPVGIASMKSTGITKPEDLKGKKVGTPVLSGASYVGMKAIMSAAGLQDSDLQVDTIGFNQVESLSAGKEDAVVVYIANEPVQLRAQGYEINLMKTADYKQLVSNGLITSETMVREHPEQIKSLNAAMLKAMEFTKTNPDEVYDICKKYVENLANADEAVQKEVLRTSIELWQGGRMGASQPQAWENMQQVLLDMGLISEKMDLSKAYSNEFLPE